jgi:Ca2+-binding RTX toxin-like protein
MKRAPLLVVAVALFFAFTLALQAQTNVRVLTYNIHRDIGASDSNISSQPALAKVVNYLNPDIWTINELGGNDVAFMGAGNDTFVWNPGDGSDTVEGQAGTDTMLFNGANVAENIDISANGGRVRLTRDVANVTMDLNGVEHIDFHALGGADNITVNDLSGTDVTQVDIDLAGAPNTGDGQPDQVIVVGSASSDTIKVVQGGDTVSVRSKIVELGSSLVPIVSTLPAMVATIASVTHK